MSLRERWTYLDQLLLTLSDTPQLEALLPALLLPVMMINKSLPTKQSINKAVKRKLGGQTVHENNLIEGNVEKNKKVPLKAELIVKLNNLVKEHEALKVEHEALKLENTKYIEINNNLERKIEDLEKSSKKTEQTKLEAGDEDLDLS